jgi:hypothetical protein
MLDLEALATLQGQRRFFFFPSGERRCYCSVFHKAKAIQVSEYETNFPHSLTYVHVGFKLIVYVCLNRAGVIHCIVLVSIECLLYYNVCNQYLYSILHC